MNLDTAILMMAMRLLAPTSDVPALAEAIVASGATWDEATMLVAIAYREGSNRLNVVGDHGRALSAFQLHHAPRAVLTDANLAVRIGLDRLRASARLCPATPLAAYAGAPCGSETAARISSDRDRLRRRVFAKIGMVLQ